MNKRDIIKEITKTVGITEREAQKAIDGMVKAIADALKRGEEVSLVDLGTFSIRKREECAKRNPRTGEVRQIKARRVPSFKAGQSLKLAVDPGTDDPGPSIKEG